MNKKILGLYSFLMLLASFSLSFAADSTPIEWQHWSPAVFEQAKKQHKLVFIFGKVEWCHWCQAMASNTFQDPALIQVIKANYIPVKIDLDKEPRLASKYNIRDLPTLIVVDEKDRVIKKFFGFYLPGRLEEQLKRLLE